MVVEPTLCIDLCMYVIASSKKAYNSKGMSVVGFTDLSGKELHIEIGVGIVVTSWKPVRRNG